jgi:hypothetical protein
LPLWLKGLPGGLSLGLLFDCSGCVGLVSSRGWIRVTGSLVVLGFLAYGLVLRGYNYLSGGLGNVVLELHMFVQY